MDSFEDCAMINTLEIWVEEHQDELLGRGLSARFSRGPAFDKASVWLDIDSQKRLGRLTFWSTGEAVLSIADIQSGESIAEEQRQINSPVELEDVVQSLIALVAGID
jgi:hypothetical protein